MRSSLETQPGDRAFSTWCVMQHARPILIHALRAWGLRRSAAAIESTQSLSALKLTAQDAYRDIHRIIWFSPARRDLARALSTLQVALAFAGRGDSQHTAAMALGVFSGAAGALAWRRPWQRLRWRQRQAEVIATARREQQIKHLETTGNALATSNL